MNRKRNVSFIKPEDPKFLKELKIQAGFDDRNHKFDELDSVEDTENDEESEKPQVVVLKKGDLTAEEAEIEQRKIELETKADLTQRIIFKSKSKTCLESNKRKKKETSKINSKKSRPLLSFNEEDEND